MGTKVSNSTKKATGKTAVKKVVKMKKAAAPAPKEKKAKTPKEKTPSKFIGITTGMRVQAFQDQLMKKNYREKLSDSALAAAMREEFPNAVAFNEKHVAGIRSQWNHGHRPSQEGVAPEKMLARFDDEGLPMNPRARTAKAEKPAKAAAKKGAAKKAKAAPPVEEEEEIEEEEDLDEDEGDEDEDEGDEDDE